MVIGDHDVRISSSDRGLKNNAVLDEKILKQSPLPLNLIASWQRSRLGAGCCL